MEEKQGVTSAAYQSRMLMFQLNDVFVSLASGMSTDLWGPMAVQGPALRVLVSQLGRFC